MQQPLLCTEFYLYAFFTSRTRLYAWRTGKSVRQSKRRICSSFHCFLFFLRLYTATAAVDPPDTSSRMSHKFKLLSSPVCGLLPSLLSPPVKLVESVGSSDQWVSRFGRISRFSRIGRSRQISRSSWIGRSRRISRFDRFVFRV